MRKLLISVVLFLAIIFLSGIANAQQMIAVGSGVKDASGAVSAVKGALTGVLIVTDGSNNASVIVYDHATAASGTVLYKGTIAGWSWFGGATYEVPIRYKNGIYVALTGTGANYVIYYIPNI